MRLIDKLLKKHKQIPKQSIRRAKIKSNKKISKNMKISDYIIVAGIMYVVHRSKKVRKKFLLDIDRQYQRACAIEKMKKSQNSNTISK